MNKIQVIPSMMVSMVVVNPLGKKLTETTFRKNKRRIILSMTHKKIRKVDFQGSFFCDGVSVETPW